MGPRQHQKVARVPSKNWPRLTEPYKQPGRIKLYSRPEISSRKTAIRAAQVSCGSLEELSDATGGWELDWRQLDRGRLSGDLLQVEMSATLVSRFQFDRQFHQRGMSPAGMRSFGIVGMSSSPVMWKDREGSKYQIEVFPARDTYEAVSHPGFVGNGVSVSEARIRSTAETLGLPDPLERLSEGSCFIEPERRRMVALRRILQSLYEAMSAGDMDLLGQRASSELESEILTALVAALTSGLDTDIRPPVPTVRTRALRSALDYIEANADTAPSIKYICRVSGVSYRTLNYAFHERFGLSPKQYLQAVRLDRVRKDLRKVGPRGRINDIANRWGFWHMGQFAADYRRQFGELPSEPLQRTRKEHQ